VAADLVGAHELLELSRRGARRLQISGGYRDLHVSRESSKPRERFLDLLERACDSGDGRIDLPFRETEQCKSRLRVMPQLVRARVRAVGG